MFTFEKSLDSAKDLLCKEFSELFASFNDIYKEQDNPANMSRFTKTELGVEITKNIPGFNKKNVGVKFKNDIILVELFENGDCKKKFKYKVSPDKYDLKTMQAQVQDGVLKISIKKFVKNEDSEFTVLEVY